MLTFGDPPQLYGSLDTEIAYFPDDLVIPYVEEMLLDQVGDKLAEALPPKVAELTADSLQLGDYGDWLVDLDLQDIRAEDGRLAIQTQADLGWLGDASCPEVDVEPRVGARNPLLDFDPSLGSSVAVGLTEAQLDKMLRRAWADGYFCFDEGELSALSVGLSDLISKGDLQTTVGLLQPPLVTIQPGGSEVLLEDLLLAVTADVGGGRSEIIELRLDLRGLRARARRDRLLRLAVRRKRPRRGPRSATDRGGACPRRAGARGRGSIGHRRPQRGPCLQLPHRRGQLDLVAERPNDDLRPGGAGPPHRRGAVPGQLAQRRREPGERRGDCGESGRRGGGHRETEGLRVRQHGARRGAAVDCWIDFGGGDKQEIEMTTFILALLAGCAVESSSETVEVSSSYTCCLNGSYYTCADTEATLDCGEGDTSGCTRDAGGDAECGF